MKQNTKPKKDSLITLTKKYANNNEACIKFFFDMKWPTGFYCEKCGCTHYYAIERHNVFQCAECGHQFYLLAGTIFQDSKLELYKIIIGLYMFFTSNKGISAVEMANILDVNYKTALLLNRKCRVLMNECNYSQKLDSLFYEADVAYIGKPSSGKGKQGCGTDKQPFLAVISTKENNNLPLYLKVFPINADRTEYIEPLIKENVVLSEDRKFNTDGGTTFKWLEDYVQITRKKINYSKDDHRCKWINVAISSLKENITGIYKGVAKRDLPLFFNEQVWRMNHRYSGDSFMAKAKIYIRNSKPMTKKAISLVLDMSFEYERTVSNG